LAAIVGVASVLVATSPVASLSAGDRETLRGCCSNFASVLVGATSVGVLSRGLSIRDESPSEATITGSAFVVRVSLNLGSEMGVGAGSLSASRGASVRTGVAVCVATGSLVIVGLEVGDGEETVVVESLFRGSEEFTRGAGSLSAMRGDSAAAGRSDCVTTGLLALLEIAGEASTGLAAAIGAGFWSWDCSTFVGSAGVVCSEAESWGGALAASKGMSESRDRTRRDSSCSRWGANRRRLRMGLVVLCAERR
jgi:hypothetical protein